VLGDDDRVYRQVALPREFGKVVAYLEDDTLKAQAFPLTQNLDRLEVLDLDEFRAYQVPVQTVADRTGINFGRSVIAAGGRSPQSAAGPRPLWSLDDIRW